MSKSFKKVSGYACWSLVSFPIFIYFGISFPTAFEYGRIQVLTASDLYTAPPHEYSPFPASVKSFIPFVFLENKMD